MANEAEVGKLVTAVMPLFANYKPPDGPSAAAALTKAWHMVIGHLDPDVISAALRMAVTRTQFFPTPSLVLECAAELTTTPKRTGLDAWGDVKRAIAQHGFYHPPGSASVLAVGGYDWTFDDALVGKVVAALGWRDLCMSENEMSDRARFIDAYEKEQQRAGEQARLTPDLLAFQTRQREALPAPANRSKDVALLMAGLADKKGIR